MLVYREEYTARRFRKHRSETAWFRSPVFREYIDNVDTYKNVNRNRKGVIKRTQVWNDIKKIITNHIVQVKSSNVAVPEERGDMGITCASNQRRVYFLDSHAPTDPTRGGFRKLRARAVSP